MRARFWGRVVNNELKIGAGITWTPLTKERRAANEYLKSHAYIIMEISLREDGKMEVQSRDKRMKLYPDEATLKTALLLRGVKVDE